MQGRRRDSEGSSASPSRTLYHCAFRRSSAAVVHVPVVFTTSGEKRFNEPREDSVKAYSAWQQSQVGTRKQKEFYSLAQELTLDECYSL